MDTKAITNRMHRVRGQLAKVEVAVEEGQPCNEVITQFLAVKGATNAAFAAYLKHALAECAERSEEERDALIDALVKS